jgi:hypothetical protein
VLRHALAPAPEALAVQLQQLRHSDSWDSWDSWDKEKLQVELHKIQPVDHRPHINESKTPQTMPDPKGFPRKELLNLTLGLRRNRFRQLDDQR